MATLEEATVKVALALGVPGELDGRLADLAQAAQTILLMHVIAIAVLWYFFERSLKQDVAKHGQPQIGILQTILASMMALLVMKAFSHPALHGAFGDPIHVLVGQALNSDDPAFHTDKILDVLDASNIAKLQEIIESTVTAVATSTLLAGAAITAGVIWLLVKAVSATSGAWFERKREIMILCLLIGLDSTPPLMTGAYWAAASGNIVPALAVGIF